jgi:glucose-6-phosphate isomerase
MINFTLPEKLSASVKSSLKNLEDNQILQRIWEKDHTVWHPQPDEISNRLAWLDSPFDMFNHVERIEEFVKSIQTEGYNRAFLLGMGGSSLAPEIYKRVFDVQEGFLDLSVVDSTDPDFIKAISENIVPEKTLFIVSTKSGGTIETLSFLKYFYNLMAQAQSIDEKSVGDHFIAITDPGSKLETIAKKYNFREIFLNDPNIGGRYSALSFFGLVPAALIGIDISILLNNAKDEAQKSTNESSWQKNNGAILGTILGEAANHGIDKLTFHISSEINSFGDWVEQLIAESTGKSGKGILPVVGELPSRNVEVYGNDRQFVFITLKTGAYENFNEFKNMIEAAGHPSISIELNDKYDLGKLIFVWELATSIAGHILNIHPFNQPNVESAKILAREMISILQEGGEIQLDVKNELSINTMKEFLKTAKPNDYVGIHAYLSPSPESNTALQQIQESIRDTYHFAVTWGYGPRFLHSTGQLHKGDRGNGLFIQFISKPVNDIPIPVDAGKPESNYTFGMLKLAQAYGDAEALKKAGRKVSTFFVSEADNDTISGTEQKIKMP